MDIQIDEIADRIFRLSAFVPDIGPTGFTFNQFLIDADEPLLFHTGARHMFGEISNAISTVLPVESLRWITFGHVESDECGAMNLFLGAAPAAQVAHGAMGCMVSLNDLADRAPRPLADGEVIDLGGRRVRHIDTPPRPARMGSEGPLRGVDGDTPLRRPVHPPRERAGPDVRRHRRACRRRRRRVPRQLPCSIHRVHLPHAGRPASEHPGSHARIIVRRGLCRCPASPGGRL